MVGIAQLVRWLKAMLFLLWFVHGLFTQLCSVLPFVAVSVQIRQGCYRQSCQILVRLKSSHLQWLHQHSQKIELKVLKMAIVSCTNSVHLWIFEKIRSGLVQESLIRLKSVTPYWLLGFGSAVYYRLPRQSEKLDLWMNEDARTEAGKKLFNLSLLMAVGTWGCMFCTAAWQCFRSI